MQVLCDEWQDGKENGKDKMAKGTGSGKARIRTRLFGDIKKHKAVIEYHKGKCISMTRYEVKGSPVDRYVASVTFELKYAELINLVIKQFTVGYGVNYDVFLKSAKDRRCVMACVSLNSDYEDIGVKNCFNLCKRLIDLILRQIERDARHESDEDDLGVVISDRIDEIKTNTDTFVKFEIRNACHDKDDDTVNDIRIKAIDELIKNLEELKKKF